MTEVEIYCEKLPGPSENPSYSSYISSRHNTNTIYLAVKSWNETKCFLGSMFCENGNHIRKNLILLIKIICVTLNHSVP